MSDPLPPFSGEFKTARGRFDGFLDMGEARFLLAVIVVSAFCVIAFLRPGQEQNLFALALAAISFFFGQKGSAPPPVKPPTP